jgi:hypothetical protein
MSVLAGAIGLLVPWLLTAQWAVAEISFDSVPNFLKLTDRTPLGEAVGVATDSRKMCTYTRALEVHSYLFSSEFKR